MEAVAGQPRSQFVQNQRKVMSDAVIFVRSFTAPGASQWWHVGGMVSVRGFNDAGMAVFDQFPQMMFFRTLARISSASICARPVTHARHQR